jgi:hypothetical protein
LSTAVTCSPAPIANRSSVAVGDTETILVGSRLMVTLPFAACTVTGNDAAALTEPRAGDDRDDADGCEGAEDCVRLPALEHAAVAGDRAATTLSAASARRVGLSISSSISSRRTKRARCDTEEAPERTALHPRTVTSA